MIGISAWRRPVDWMLGLGEPMYTLTTDYVAKLVDLGSPAVILPPSPLHHAEEVVGRLDGLIISGGGDVDPASYGATNTASAGIDAERDAWEIELVKAAERRRVPVLGICRGLQVMTVAFGGSLHQHIWNPGTDHPPLTPVDGGPLMDHPHPVDFDEGSTLYELFGPRTTVNSYHHQAADRVPERFTATGRAPDGTVEAIESVDDWQAMAVQWHPERADDVRLFEELIARSENRAVVPGGRL